VKTLKNKNYSAATEHQKQVLEPVVWLKKVTSSLKRGEATFL